MTIIDPTVIMSDLVYDAVPNVILLLIMIASFRILWYLGTNTRFSLRK